ncbi:hypothetical protein [Streptomyces sp. NPDC005859]|uniref:hypothetical protein n=1 Tax=Streptomyces sp. NPDC005859 TaxID=3157170 RepID=UPI0033E301E0
MIVINETAAHDPWSLGWDFFVAVGTILLAGVTVWLAWSTRKLSKEAAADQRAQWRPVIVPNIDRPGGRGLPTELVPVVMSAFRQNNEPALHYEKNVKAGDPLLGVSCRNAGRGPALQVRAQLEIGGAPERVSPTSISLGAVAPGDVYFIWFQVARLGPPMQLLFDYRDLGGRRHATAITIDTSRGGLRFHDVRIWENHSVTSEVEAPYPLPGLTNAAPQPKPTWLSPDWDGTVAALG